MTYPVLLETPRLRLREFQKGDEDDIHAWASDHEVVQYMIWGPNTLDHTRENLEKRLSSQKEQPRHVYELAITLKANHALIGSCDITLVQQPRTSGWLGYVLTQQYWRQGYMTEAVAAILKFGFSELNLHRIWATCDTRNVASARVMEKLGMRREAHYVKDAWEKGAWRDSFLYAILNEEWIAKKLP